MCELDARPVRGGDRTAEHLDKLALNQMVNPIDREARASGWLSVPTVQEGKLWTQVSDGVHTFVKDTEDFD